MTEIATAMAVDAAVTPEVFDAQVVAMFPPRPDAIMTLLHDDDFLPGTQALLYSIHVSNLYEVFVVNFRREFTLVDFPYRKRFLASKLTLPKSSS